MNVIEQEYDEAIPVADLVEHPDNPRRGSDEAVTESIENNDFFGAILVQKSSKRILAGNTRYRSMSAAGQDTIPGFWIDCDDETALRILLADNRVSDLAFYDDRILVDLLHEINDTAGSLMGTGYDQTSYELLMQSANADEIMGGVRQGLTPGDRQGDYEAADIRSIILPLGSDDYERLVDGLAQLRSELDLPSNADVVLHLVELATSSVA